MSNGFINLVWDYNADNSGQKLVLLALADHADKNGFCFPGTDKLSTKTGLSKRMVQYHLEALKTKGVVKIEYNQGTKTISGHTNKYQLVRGAMEFTPLEQGVQPTSPDGVQCTSPDGVQPTSPKPSVKPPVKPIITTPPKNLKIINTEQEAGIALMALTTNYEDCISVSISPLLADEFKDYSWQVTPEWVVNAYKATVSANVQNWNYPRKILDECIKAGSWAEKTKPQRTKQNGKSSQFDTTEEQKRQHAETVRAAIAAKRLAAV